MKNIYTLLVIALLSSSKSFGSEFILQIFGSEQVFVTTGNQTQTNYTNQYHFYNLPSGMTTVKIVSKVSGITLFQNNVIIPSDYQVYANLNGNTLTVTGFTPLFNNSATVGNVIYASQPGNNNGNWNNGNNNGNWNNGGNGNWNNGNNAVYFNQFLETLKNESFDSSKLKTAKDYASKTQLSAQEIKQVAELFSFDSSRLEWTKAAYASCYDKQNYFLLKNAFSFSSSYDNLLDYINGK